MEEKLLRTYRRRSATRESGFHTCEETTGGECMIRHAERITAVNGSLLLRFERDNLELVDLFERDTAIIAFGGYVCSTQTVTVSLSMAYTYENEMHVTPESEQILEADNWLNIGIHAEQIMNKSSHIDHAVVCLSFASEHAASFDFISFDFDTVKKNEFTDSSCAVSFYQNTHMYIPYLYYLRSDLSILQHLRTPIEITVGKRMVLKSCNRCGRYLPINIDDELKTLSFSLHCKKRAPCKHSTFRAYEIQNRDMLQPEDLSGLKIEDNKVVSYYGHQLECKACKKFFVNAPLNPQRNAQQFKEDALGRRAIEVLINTLLKRNLIHFEFEKRTKKEFSRYIWEKFDKQCFKCGPSSNQIALSEMALDHTMPLVYLYRLDETATCLCKKHNSQKSDFFPVDYYSEEELARLSRITGLSSEQLRVKSVNETVLNLLIQNVVWFYDSFLMNPDYQKIRDGIRTADKINDSIKRVIAGKVDLTEEYRTHTGHYPASVSIKNVKK